MLKVNQYKKDNYLFVNQLPSGEILLRIRGGRKYIIISGSKTEEITDIEEWHKKDKRVKIKKK